MSDKNQVTAFSSRKIHNENKSAPTWIEIIPANKFSAIDGRGPFYLSDPQKVIDASIRLKTDLLVDRDHETSFSKPGTQVRAAGWIKEMEVRDGAIWAKVDWVDEAAQEITAKKYRYVSPEFTSNKKTGEITRIIRLSITNDPALEIISLAHRQKNLPPLQSTQENNMNLEEFLKKLADAMGKTETFTAEQALDAFKAIASEKDTSDKPYKELCSAMGAQDGSDHDELVQLASVERLNPAEYVPMNAFKEVQEKLAKIEGDNVKEIVTSAMREGKLSPSLEEWGLNLASSNRQAFDDFISKNPSINGTSSISNNSQNTSETNEDTLEMCSRLGIDPEEYKKFKEGEV